MRDMKSKIMQVDLAARNTRASLTVADNPEVVRDTIDNYRHAGRAGLEPQTTLRVEKITDISHILHITCQAGHGKQTIKRVLLCMQQGPVGHVQRCRDVRDRSLDRRRVFGTACTEGDHLVLQQRTRRGAP